MLLAVLHAAPLAAQDPAPRDPDDVEVVEIPPEAVVQDTLPTPEIAPVDTLQPAPNFPSFPRAEATGFSEGIWEWDRSELARWHGMSLVALLEQVPGLLATRGGWYGRPTGLAAFGSGGSRLRVLLDGYELDPLDAAVFDIHQVAIVDLAALRVARTLAETRIELFTFRQPDQRSFSQIEAATALFRTRILRGLFSTTTGDRGLLTLGLDLTDSDGWLNQQPYSANSLLARYGHRVGENTGLQLEFRQTNLERSGVPFSFQGNRRDVILRARTLVGQGIGLEATAGRSWRRPGGADSLGLDLETVQAGVRGHVEHSTGWMGGGARLRGGDSRGILAPTLELMADAGLRPVPLLLATGSSRLSRTGGVTGVEFQGGVRAGPLSGFSLFAHAAAGGRGVVLLRDTVLGALAPGEPELGDPVEDSTFYFPSVSSQLRAVRIGAEWSRWGAMVGGAWLVHDLERVAPFGFAFDRSLPEVEAGTAAGFEGFASIPLLYRPLRFEGSFTRWSDTGDRPYLPLEEGRAALLFHERFYDGNLEPTLRLELVSRGGALVPTADRTAFAAVSTPYTVYNLFLQIRVLDVQAFLIWDNLLNNVTASDLVGPGRSLGGQRAIYGVRWHFLD